MTGQAVRWLMRELQNELVRVYDLVDVGRELIPTQHNA
jgi:hypothetical protein